LVAKEEATGADGGYRIDMNSSGFVVFGIDNDNGTFPSDSVTSTSAYDDNKWHHFAAVKDAATSMTLYIDGISVGTPDASPAADVSNDDTFYIGIYNGASDGWIGFIDEVKVLRTARTAAQIKADFTSETPSRGSSASFGGGSQAYLSEGLVGYWRMEEAGDATRADSSGNGNTMTETTGDTIDQVTGKFGNAGDFENSASEAERLEITDASQSGLDITGPLTLCAWIKPETVAYTNVAGKFADPSDLSYLLHTDSNGSIKFYASYDGTNYYNADSAASAVTAGNWAHVCGQYDGRFLRTYVNGSPSGTPVTYTSGIHNGAASFDIGGAWGDYFDGVIDEVRVYNRTLTPSEVQSLYNWAPGPVGYWKLDENTSTSANDSSGNDNTATLTNTPNWTPGKFGSGVLFSGSDQHLTRADDADFDFADDADVTWETWFKHSTASAQEIIMSKYQEAGYKIIMESDGDITCALDYDSTWTPTDSATSTAATYDDGNWHHIACVKLGATSLTLYIDGLSIITDSSLTATNTLTNADPVYFGIDADGTSNDFTGSLDDIKIYNYALTSGQIIQDMNAGHPAPGSPVGSPIIRWKFDEGVNDTCSGGSNDACNSGLGGIAFDGAGTTHAWTNSGKFNKAINFDAQADSVSAGDVSFTDGTSAMTISLWLNPQTLTTIDTVISKTDSASAANNAFSILTNNSNSDELNIYIGDGSDFGDFLTTTNFDLTASTWQLIVVVYDGTQAADSRLKVYKNGVQMSGTISGTIPASMISSTTTNLKLGDEDTIGNTGLRSYYDDVQIFTSALTADQIKLLYNEGSNASLGTLSTNPSTLAASDSFNDQYCVPGDTTSCNPPVAEWKLDENTGTVANDTSTGGDDTGTLTFGPLWVPGKNGSAIEFDSSNTSDDYVSITDTGNLDLTSAFTIEATVYANNNMLTTDNYGIFANTVDTGSLRTGIGFSLGTIAGAVGFSTISVNNASDGQLNLSGGIPITVNKWHFLSASFLDSTNTGILTHDNFRTQNDSTILTDTPSFVSATVKIGRLHSLTAPDNDYHDFSGKIDTVRVFDYVRTPAQLAWDYSRGAPIVWFKFDECTGLTPIYNSGTGVGYDIAGAEITVTPTITIGAGGSENTIGTCSTAGTSWGNGATGKRNGSIDLDGTDDLVSFTTNHALIAHSAKTYTNVSWGGWFNPGATPVSDALITRESNTGVGEFRLITNADGKPSCEIYYDPDGGGASPAAWQSGTAVTGANALVNSAWNHIMCVYNGSTLKVYVNGRETGSSAETGSIISTVNGRLYMGRDRANTASTYFDGQVDEIKIYSYDLTLPLLYREINDGTVRFGPDTGSPQ
ncbi:MAG: hypothetical protein US39_C0011G0021, partial [Microgenomates group bacterium GW2011_GWC1_37_12b]